MALSKRSLNQLDELSILPSALESTALEIAKIEELFGWINQKAAREIRELREEGATDEEIQVIKEIILREFSEGVHAAWQRMSNSTFWGA